MKTEYDRMTLILIANEINLATGSVAVSFYAPLVPCITIFDRRNFSNHIMREKSEANFSDFWR